MVVGGVQVVVPGEGGRVVGDVAGGEVGHAVVVGEGKCQVVNIYIRGAGAGILGSNYQYKISVVGFRHEAAIYSSGGGSAARAGSGQHVLVTNM